MKIVSTVWGWVAIPVIVAAPLLLLVACSTDADVASENVSKAAEQFEVPRLVTGINGITDEVILEVEGFCSFEDYTTRFDVICKLEDGSYVKHVIGRSDNVTYVVEQLSGVEASTSQYRFVVKPSAIIPNIDVQ
jgi:hypothetical protein